MKKTYLTLCMALFAAVAMADTLNPDSASVNNIPGEDFDTGVSTAVKTVKDNRKIMNDRVFNLQGKQVAKGTLDGLPKGIYVLRGKKYVVK